MFFVKSRVTNHHDEGHFRKLETLSYAFSMHKVVGFGGMRELRGFLFLFLITNGFLPIKHL